MIDGCLIISVCRLTTPFDIHATLLDVLHWPTEDKLKTPGKTSRRSLSLFAPIPLSRTCAQVCSLMSCAQLKDS